MNISLLFQDVNYLCIHPDLAVAIGRNEAILLVQIGYWCHKNSTDSSKVASHFIDGMWWMYNTFQDWVDDIKICSERTLKTAIKNLRDAGLIFVEKHSPNRGDRTNWYALNYEAVGKLFERLGIGRPDAPPPPNHCTMHRANSAQTYKYSNHTLQSKVINAYGVDLKKMKASKTSLPKDWECNEALREENKTKHAWVDQEMQIIVDDFKNFYYKNADRRWEDWDQSFRWFCENYKPSKKFKALREEMARKAKMRDRAGAKVEELVHGIDTEPEVDRAILQAILDAVGSRKFAEQGFWSYRVSKVDNGRLRITRKHNYIGALPTKWHAQIVSNAAQALGIEIKQVEFV
jgi:hypothetical protein